MGSTLAWGNGRSPLGSSMSGFSTARLRMVDGQVRTSNVTDIRIVDAILEVPREAFVPENKRPLAYVDLDLDVTEGGSARRFLIKPMVTAKLLQAAEILRRVLATGRAVRGDAADHEGLAGLRAEHERPECGRDCRAGQGDGYLPDGIRHSVQRCADEQLAETEQIPIMCRRSFELPSAARSETMSPPWQPVAI
jgi:hypothetical protein